LQVGERPYTVLSASMSIDGYLDAGPGARLLLSNAADLERVDAVRAACDAILVGAATIRNDDPRLLVRGQRHRDARVARGLPPSPAKVTVTSAGDLDPTARFFTTGDVEKLVYCATGTTRSVRDRVGGVATVVDAGEPVDLSWVAGDLYRRGTRALMVEGGGTVLTQLLTGDLVDELQLVVAPFFVGDDQARRLVGSGAFPWGPARRATLADVTQIGDVVLLRYAMSSRFTSDRLQER
jgi:5-amino-6-(5-phosphoribosylamino)uracil reductase